MSINKIHKCRNCKSKNIFKLIDFNKVPLANNLVLSSKSKVSKFELELILCKSCFLVQTTKNIDRKKIFNSDYPYLTATSSTANKNAFELYKYKLGKPVLISFIHTNWLSFTNSFINFCK